MKIISYSYFVGVIMILATGLLSDHSTNAAVQPVELNCPLSITEVEYDAWYRFSYGIALGFYQTDNMPDPCYDCEVFAKGLAGF